MFNFKYFNDFLFLTEYILEIFGLRGGLSGILFRADKPDYRWGAYFNKNGNIYDKTKIHPIFGIDDPQNKENVIVTGNLTSSPKSQKLNNITQEPEYLSKTTPNKLIDKHGNLKKQFALFYNETVKMKRTDIQENPLITEYINEPNIKLKLEQHSKFNSQELQNLNKENEINKTKDITTEKKINDINIHQVIEELPQTVITIKEVLEEKSKNSEIVDHGKTLKNSEIVDYGKTLNNLEKNAIKPFIGNTIINDVKTTEQTNIKEIENKNKETKITLTKEESEQCIKYMRKKHYDPKDLVNPVYYDFLYKMLNFNPTLYPKEKILETIRRKAAVNDELLQNTVRLKPIPLKEEKFSPPQTTGNNLSDNGVNNLSDNGVNNLN